MINLPQSDSINPLEKQKYYEVSHGQRRLWILQHISESSSAYNIRLAMRINGKLDVFILTAAFQELVNRHEILRTTFASVGGNIKQVIHEQIPTEQLIIFKDLRGEKDAELLADDLIQESANLPFSLEKLPLIRVLLVQINSEEFIFGLTVHHIIGDAQSLDIIFQEFFILYSAYTQQKKAELPPLTLQYKDYAAWQNQWLESEEVREQHEYWCEVFAEHTPILNLPIDFPRPQVKSSQAASHTYQFSESLSQKLQTFATQNNTTLFITLLTFFKILLYRHTGQRDLVVGIPISARNHPDLENQIGFYVNTLALRTLLPEGVTFRQVLAAVTNTCLDAYEYRDYPFDKLVSTLNLERDLSRNPLFDVMFSLLGKESKTVLKIPGLEHQPYPLKPRMAQFDMTWSFFEDSHNLTLVIEYEPDLFLPETIARMNGHFLQIIESVIQNPDCKLSEINLLTPEERHQLLIEWNQTEVAYSQQCLHQLFEEKVRDNTEAIALIFEGKKLTYRELNNRANQVSHYLQEKGVTSEVLVGIFIERSFEMIIGILGIIKAGGAYVPFDPNYPPECLNYMISDSAISLLLTQQSLVQSLPENCPEILCLDTDWSRIANYSQENLASPVTPENLAYVIYTSGSTGKPKGVMNIHRGISNTLKYTIDNYNLTSEDCILQITPFSFDVSVWEVFSSLTSGATLVVTKPDAYKDIDYLIDLIVQEQVTYFTCVPSILRVFLQHPKSKDCHCLKRVIVGGEALSYELNQRFFQQLNCQLYNAYGPTEAAVDATVWYCQPNSQISIGHPIANVQVYILDSYLQPVPIGVAGELHIGGMGLARGYLNQPELTAEKFIPNPFNSGISPTKLYKTGDLARYLPDGNIEYLGRIDNQVKLRGFRIELGEIQTVLETHPNVEQAVVIMREDTLYNQRLVAYVMRKDTLLTSQELHRFLQQKLPVYMIPSAFVLLSDFPLNPNGKIDVHKLPIPDETSLVESPYLAPRNSTETILVSLWQQLLQGGKIGVNDNFFELGGHSLQAMNLMALIYEKMAIEIPLSMIYEKPTVAELSDYIIYAQEMNIQPKERPYVVFNKEQKKAVFLFPPALGFAAAYANLAEYLTNYAIYTFRYISDELMLKKYAELIEDLAQNQDIKLMGHSAGGFLAMLMAQQLESRGRVVSDVILLDTYRGGREAKKADMSEIQEGVDAFLLNPKRQELRGYFLENQKLRNRTYNQVWEYFNFLWNSDLKNVQIQGTIHLIRAEGNYEAEDDWTQATKGERINHYATGIHREMIDPPYLPKNALIINSILNPKQS